MQKSKTTFLVKLLRKTANELEAGSTYLSEEEQIELISLFCHKALSKEECCSFLNIKRSRFDDLVRAGKIPRGKKIRGRTQLIWFEDDLRTYLDTEQ